MTLTTGITEQQINAGLLSGDSLGPWWISYSVANSKSTWTDYQAGTQPSQGYSTLSTAQGRAFTQAIAAWDAIISNDFNQVTETGSDHGTIRIAFTSYEMDGSAAYAYYPGYLKGMDEGSDIWISSLSKQNSFALGTYDFEVLLHEIGHALGLKHSFETPVIPTAFDNTQYTIMSYTDPVASIIWTFVQESGGIRSQGAYVVDATPMVLDIAAAQSLYGAEMSTATGDTVYTFTQGVNYRQAIYDAGGTDTIDASNFTRPVLIDLNPGAYSSMGQWTIADQIAAAAVQYSSVPRSFIESVLDDPTTYTWTDNLGIAFSTVIENAIGGSAADQLTGNTANNMLFGGLGDDVLTGGDGNDVLNGGLGIDRLSGGNGDDRIYYDASDNPANVQGGAGVDRLVVNYLAPLPTFDLAAHGFEFFEKENADTGNSQNFSSIQSLYTQAGLLAESFTFYDDGTWSYSDYDETNSAAYSRIDNANDALSRLVNQLTSYDDGTSSSVIFDAAGTLTYTRIVNAQDAQGRTVNQLTVYDDGTSSSVIFDAANTQTYTRIVNAQDTQGRTVNQLTEYDNGTSSSVIFDAANTQAYTRIVNAQDNQGRTTNQLTTYDNGVSVSVLFDYDNSHNYTQIINSVDALGRTDTQEIRYDSGARTFIDYDQANSESWSQHVTEFGTDGTTVLRDYLIL